MCGVFQKWLVTKYQLDCRLTNTSFYQVDQELTEQTYSASHCKSLMAIRIIFFDYLASTTFYSSVFFFFFFFPVGDL